MKAQDIMSQYETVVAEYDVKKLLCNYCDADVVVEDIVLCIAKHTSPKWARSLSLYIKDIVRGVDTGDPCYMVGGRAEKYNFVFDRCFFLGYNPDKGVILRRRA